MNRSLRFLLSTAALTALLATRTFAAESASAGYVDFGKFIAADHDGKYVEVNIKENLLAFTAAIAKTQEPDLAKLIGGLKLIRVNVVGVDEKNRGDVTARIGKVRTELEAQGWERTVTVRDNGDDVAIFVKSGKGSVIEGLVVTVLGRNQEAVFVNIVGNIDPEQIATNAAKFDIPQLKDLPKIHKAPAADTKPEAAS